MDGEASEFHPKQERLRTRWTASLDKIFADLVVEQIQLGNRPNQVFDKKTWNIIRDEFNKRTDLNFNNNQLRKHLDVLRTRYHNVKSAFNQNDFVMDDACCIGFDLWEDLGAQANKPETTKTKECPIYDQLCMIFADSGADGQYAQSSHYDGLDKPIGASAGNSISYPENGSPEVKALSSSKIAQGNTSSAHNASKNTADRKRKRASDAEQAMKDQESIEAMGKAITEMVAASKSRIEAMTKQEDRFTITNCVKALDEIEAVEGIDFHLYYAALDLFEDPNLRETFISLKNTKIRLTWLQGKCGNNAQALNLRG